MVSDSDDRVKVIEFHIMDNIPVAFFLNYSNFSNSCIFVQLFGINDSFEVVVDRVDFNAEQFGHFLLAEPEGLILKEDRYMHPPHLESCRKLCRLLMG